MGCDRVEYGFRRRDRESREPAVALVVQALLQER
jgi:hypothetical protein